MLLEILTNTIKNGKNEFRIKTTEEYYDFCFTEDFVSHKKLRCCQAS